MQFKIILVLGGPRVNDLPCAYIKIYLGCAALN